MSEFLVFTPEFIRTRDDYGDVYLLKIKLSNIGGSTGLVDLTFRMPGQGGFGGGGGGMSTEQRLFEIEAGITKEIQLVFYDQPRMLTINTLVSGNIPSSFNVFLRSAETKTISNLEEYERIVENSLIGNDQNEIIVDNEDPGFSYVSVSHESKVKKYIDSKKVKSEGMNYQAINQYWSLPVWSPVVHSGMYGQTIRSAYVVRKGDGSSVAKWSVRIPEAGFYDIYVYIPVSSMYKGPSGRNRGGENNAQGQGERPRGPEFVDNGTEYTYLVSSNEGDEEVNLTLNQFVDGWNDLGSFHFPADSAFISLTNKTNGSRVIADAVKWVPKD